jgi:hypothetical protein
MGGMIFHPSVPDHRKTDPRRWKGQLLDDERTDAGHVERHATRHHRQQIRANQNQHERKKRHACGDLSRQPSLLQLLVDETGVISGRVYAT